MSNPGAGCTLDGVWVPCDMAYRALGSGAAVIAPPETTRYNYTKKTFEYFRAFADGYAGFLPADARYSGNGRAFSLSAMAGSTDELQGLLSLDHERQNPFRDSNSNCSIEVRFRDRLSKGTPRFFTGPDHSKLGQYNGVAKQLGLHHGFRIEVIGSVSSGGIGQIGDSSENPIRIPGGGEWRIGQWKYPFPSSHRNGVPVPEAGKTTGDSPRYLDPKSNDLNFASVAVRGQQFAWHDEPGLSEDEKHPLQSGVYETNFVAYVTNGQAWCGVRFYISGSYVNGTWQASIHHGNR
jgi:hypothetical protein